MSLVFKTRIRLHLGQIFSSINGHVGSASGFGTLVDLSAALMLFVSGLLTARALGSDGRGELAAGTALISLAFFAGNMGLHTSNSFYVARGEIPDRILVGNSLMGTAVFGVAASSALFLISTGIPSIKGSAPTSVVLFGCLLLPMMFLDIYITYILIGKKLFVETGALSLTSRVMSALLIVAACLWFPSVLSVFLATMVTVPLRLLLTLILMRHTPLFARPVVHWSFFKKSMGYALRVRASEVFQFLNLRLDIFLLNYMTNAAGLGVYTLGVFISEFCWYPVNGLTRVLYPRIAERSSTEPKESAQVALTWCRIALAITIFLGICVTGVGYLLIVPLFGSEFTGARLVLLLLLPGTLTYSVSRILTDALAGLGFPHLGSVVALTSLAVTVGLDLLLIPRYGINGAAIASSAAYTTSAILASMIFGRRTGTGLFDAFLVRHDEVARLIAVVPKAIGSGCRILGFRQSEG